MSEGAEEVDAPYHVEIVGLQRSNNGRRCEIHNPCGDLVRLDTLLHVALINVENGTSLLWWSRHCRSG